MLSVQRLTESRYDCLRLELMAANSQNVIYAEATRSRPASTIEHQMQEKTIEETWNTEKNA